MQDKKGVCLTKFVIMPVLETVENKVKEYKKICREMLQNSQNDSDTREKIGNYMCCANELLQQIDLKKAHEPVLKYIAPHFQIEL